MHYFQFEIKEWIANTAHLSLEEEAAYFRLIIYYYDAEKPINNADITKVFRRCRIPEQLGCFILAEFFQCQDEQNWIHKRCDEEIAKYHAKKEQASRAGKASAEHRASARLTTVQPIINHKPLITNQNKNTIAKPDGLSDDLWKDFLILRKTKKLAVTQTAMKGIVREAAKAKKSLEEVLQICCERGWGGFKAEWIDESLPQKGVGAYPKRGEEWRNNDNLMIAKANELCLYTEGLQRFEIVNKIAETIRTRGL